MEGTISAAARAFETFDQQRQTRILLTDKLHGSRWQTSDAINTDTLGVSHEEMFKRKREKRDSEEGDTGLRSTDSKCNHQHRDKRRTARRRNAPHAQSIITDLPCVPDTPGPDNLSAYIVKYGIGY